MRIVIVGTGYVGLVTGACFAEMGHTVMCVDIDENKINTLCSGKIPIYEPGLEELVARGRAQKRLLFTTSYETAMADTDVCFICVSTPARPDGKADLHALKKASESIAAQMSRHTVIVNKSTVPVGTAELVRTWITEGLDGRSIPFDVVSNPEFLKEGCAITDCMKPDRIVIGSDNKKAAQIINEIYTSFSINHDRILHMDIRSAEMTKYAANAMLAMRISFMNEIAGICEACGADISEVRQGIGSDKRIGYDFLYAGVGFGGSCFPKDLRALRATAREHNSQTLLLDAVENINAKQKKVLGKKISNYFSSQGGLLGKTIAIWGIAFKPDTDDIREAPSLDLIQQLLGQGAHVRLYDPVALPNAKREFNEASGVTFCTSEYEASHGADAIALVTEWKQFRSIDLEKILDRMNGSALFDGRNQYKPREMRKRGFDYFAIGNGTDQQPARAACPS
jgi:UDPglucose 6-dehydrogenase